MIEECDESLFIQRFENMGRVETAEKGGNFTYRGLRALFEYLDDTYDEENPLKLDVIALCCEFVEYKNLEEYKKDYDILTDREEYALDDEGYLEAIEKEINDTTILIKLGDDLSEGFIIGSY